MLKKRYRLQFDNLYLKINALKYLFVHACNAY